MGTDNLHHKRKQRNLNSLARKSKNRKPYDRVLIICEGEKTEPNYFKGLCKQERLDEPNVYIRACSTGTDPVNIINYAIKVYDENKDYDRVYCIFDKENKNYYDALNKVNSSFRNDIPIYAVTSVPCFEYWILLHFEDTTRPYYTNGRKTAGNQVIADLKKHIKNYRKSDRVIFDKTALHLETAIKRAKKIKKQQDQNQTDNPSTDVYKLVEYLINIKN